MSLSILFESEEVYKRFGVVYSVPKGPRSALKSRIEKHPGCILLDCFGSHDEDPGTGIGIPIHIHVGNLATLAASISQNKL